MRLSILPLILVLAACAAPPPPGADPDRWSADRRACEMQAWEKTHTGGNGAAAAQALLGPFGAIGGALAGAIADSTAPAVPPPSMDELERDCLKAKGYPITPDMRL